MKKIDLGQTITILANVGVIAGIVFLAIEVRESRVATEMQTVEGITEGWISLNEAFLESDYTRIHLLGLYRPDELSTVEAARFSMYLRMFNNHVNRIGRYSELGLITESEYQSALREMATTMSTPGGRVFRATEPGFEEQWADRLRPYEGSEAVFNLLLGRDPSSIE